MAWPTSPTARWRPGGRVALPLRQIPSAERQGNGVALLHRAQDLQDGGARWSGVRRLGYSGADCGVKLVARIERSEIRERRCRLHDRSRISLRSMRATRKGAVAAAAA